jgi:hypothetical protein
LPSGISFAEPLGEVNVMNDKLNDIRVGFQTYLEEGGEEFGAVRQVGSGARDEIVIYVENAGDFVVPGTAIRNAHDGKVILDPAKLDEQLREAIAHAHESEKPGL